MYNYKTLKLAEMRKELVRTRARTEGEKMPYQRDKPHFTEKSAVPDAYHIRTISVPHAYRVSRNGVVECWSGGVMGWCLVTLEIRLGL